jgi:hypothetical protein
MTAAMLLVGNTPSRHQEATMTTRKHSRLAALRARIKRLWSELADANRRMFDIRTASHFMKRQERPPGSAAR